MAVSNINSAVRAGLDEAFKKMTRVFGLTEGYAISNISDLLNNAQDLGTSVSTPGDATVNATAGTSAIALGAQAAVITNSFCAAGDLIMVTPLDTDATLVTYKAVSAAGSFTVTGGAVAAAIWKFQWQVIKKVI